MNEKHISLGPTVAEQNAAYGRLMREMNTRKNMAAMTMDRPKGSNADEWLLFLTEYSKEFCAVQIAEAIEEAVRKERERCALVYESVNPASDDERYHHVPGAGAMGAVIEFRDKIRKLL